MATAPVGAVQRSHRNVHLVSREIAVIGIAGAIVGVLVGGLGSRIFMRIAGAVAPDAMQGATTEAGARIGEITLAARSRSSSSSGSRPGSSAPLSR